MSYEVVEEDYTRYTLQARQLFLELSYAIVYGTQGRALPR